ncbi:MAG TPA: acylphosphatase, partial [Kofleriaceae bacterium]|nr:acylphosphatase [Kofleriaceae bacterium]
MGFRPAMYRLAKAVGVGGLVRNDRHGVWLEIEGSQEAVAQFIKALPRAAPPSARIESVATWEKEVRGDRDLVIAASTDDHSTP